MKNFIKLEKLSLLYAHYAFTDTEEYLADQIFVKHKIKVDFGKEYANADSPYLIIFCKVRKTHAADFESALREMGNKMILMGHIDYEEWSAAFLEEMEA